MGVDAAEGTVSGRADSDGKARAGRRWVAGFTLVEVMVVLVIVALLATVAYPSYVQHLVRGSLAAAASELDARRSAMEQYFLSNRTYVDGPCGSGSSVEHFAFTCSVTASTYTVTATGSGIAAGFVYTLDQHGTQKTTGLPSAWGTLPSAGYFACWVRRPGETC